MPVTCDQSKGHQHPEAGHKVLAVVAPHVESKEQPDCGKYSHDVRAIDVGHKGVGARCGEGSGRPEATIDLGQVLAHWSLTGNGHVIRTSSYSPFSSR